MDGIGAAAKEKYATVGDLAARLGCVESHVIELVAGGKLTAVRIGPRALRISERSFEQFVAGTIGEIVKRQSSFTKDEPKTVRTLSPAPVVARSSWMCGGPHVEAEGYSHGSCRGGQEYTVTSPLQNYQNTPPEKNKATPDKYKSRTIFNVERSAALPETAS